MDDHNWCSTFDIIRNMKEREMDVPHYHCPNDCEKPQPSIYEGKAYCMRCMAEGRGTVEMFACTPETCDDGEVGGEIG